MDLPIDIFFIILDNLKPTERVKFSKINQKTKDIHNKYVRICLFPKLFKDLVYVKNKKDGKIDIKYVMDKNNNFVLEKIESTMFTIVERQHNIDIVLGKPLYILYDIQHSLSSNYFIIIGKNIRSVRIFEGTYISYKRHYLGNDIVKFEPVANSILYKALWNYNFSIEVIADKVDKIYEKINMCYNDDVDFLQRQRIYIPNTIFYHNKKLYKELNYVSGLVGYRLHDW